MRPALPLLLFVCTTPALAQPSPVEVGESSISLPVRVDFSEAFALAESEVPTSVMRWTSTDWSAAPFGFRYQVHREALRFTTSGDRIGVSTRLRYALRVFARAGAFGQSVDGEVGQCGTPGREAYREAQVGLDAQVVLSSEYRIVSTTRVRAPRFPNPCRLTFARYDATPMLRRTSAGLLEQAARTIDARVAERGDLRSYVLDAWAALHRVIPLGGGAALVVRPVGISAVPLRFEGRVAVTGIEIRFATSIASARTPAPEVTPLPPLETARPVRGTRFTVDTSVNFEEIAQMAEHTLAGERFPMGRYGTLRITRVRLSADGRRVRVNLGLRGVPVSAISLVGTPTWDPETNVLSFADLDYVVHGGGMVVGFIEEARHGAMRARLRSMLRFDLGGQGADLRARLREALVGHDLGRGVRVTGDLAAPRVTALRVREDGLDVSMVIEGDLALHVAVTPR